MHLQPNTIEAAAFVADHLADSPAHGEPIFPGTERVGPKLISGRRRSQRTARQMAAVALKWAGTFRRGGNLEAAREWLAEAHGWRVNGRSMRLAPRTAVS